MLRIGIIGLGYWGKHYVRIVSKSDRCHLTALCDVFEDTLNKYNYINVDKYINYISIALSALVVWQFWILSG